MVSVLTVYEPSDVADTLLRGIEGRSMSARAFPVSYIIASLQPYPNEVPGPRASMFLRSIYLLMFGSPSQTGTLLMLHNVQTYGNMQPPGAPAFSGDDQTAAANASKDRFFVFQAT